MTKRTLLLLIELICLTNWIIAQVQLKVGDPAPSIEAYTWIKGNPIQEWNQKQFYLIEFGATWCKPCAEAIPKLSALENEYQAKLKVATVFVMEQNDPGNSSSEPSYIPRVKRYVEKRNDQISYAMAIDGVDKKVEKAWLHKAGLSGLPHMFLIHEGRIAYIGSSYNAIKSIIDSEGKQIVNNPPRYDRNKLFLIDGNGGNQNDFLFRSVMALYDGKSLGESFDFIQTSGWKKPDSVYVRFADKVEVFGGSLKHLYYIAYADTFSNQVPVRSYTLLYPDTIAKPYTNNSYGKYWYKPVLEVSDSSLFDFDYKKIANRFNYSLKVPKGAGTSAFLQTAMQNDLRTYFGYEVTVETRQMPCWNLTIADPKKILAIKSKTQSAKYTQTMEPPFKMSNANTRDIIWMLGSYYGYGYFDYGKLDKKLQAPFIDKTGLSDKFDFMYDPSLTFDQFVAYLHSIGFELTRSTKSMKVVVIRDPKL